MTGRSLIDSSTWETIGTTEDGQRVILRNPANGLPCCYDLNGWVSPEVYERNRQKRIRDAGPAMLEALAGILYEFDGNDDNTISLTSVDMARAAIRAAKGYY